MSRYLDFPTLIVCRDLWCDASAEIDPLGWLNDGYVQAEFGGHAVLLTPEFADVPRQSKCGS